MNLYEEQWKAQQQRLNDFLSKNGFFAFDREQFREGMEGLGLDPEDKGKVTFIAAGGYVLADKYQDFIDILNQSSEEREAALADPVKGRQFAEDMFFYELNNHEYSYTGEEEETLEALGYDPEDLASNPLLLEALKAAEDRIWRAQG